MKKLSVSAVVAAMSLSFTGTALAHIVGIATTKIGEKS